ncbi:MAG TPA: portal protein, partial [Vicinamibacterales bacterium]|nr:portal protein [Vicinamibacterales bacterium]
ALGREERLDAAEGQQPLRPKPHGAGGLMAAETKRDRFQKRLTQLKSLREPLIPEWRELAENFVPRTLPWLLDRNAQSTRDRRNKKIINTAPVMAARTLKRGMTAGVASPARPWFRLQHPDRDLNKYQPVRLWLDEAVRVIEDMFARSNFYNALGMGYGEEGIFGTSALGMFEDAKDDLRCYPYPIGSYLIANSARGSVDTFYRELRYTVRQYVQEFVMKDDRGRPLAKPDWSRASSRVRHAYDRNDLEMLIDLVHVIEENDERDTRYLDSRHMLIRSCYYECGTEEKSTLLRESGFEELPVLVSRWDVNGDDPWGTGPALEALGDAKALQFRERQKAKRIDKHNDPSLVGHPDLKNKRVSLLPGDITYVGFTPTGGAPMLQPTHMVNHDIASLLEDIRDIEARISRIMDEDLFLMLSMSETKDVTAEAIARKYEEKVTMLGPVLERQNDEKLDPAIDRAFAIALRRGLLPPPPEELEGQPLKTEYVSVLAQAQRLVSASSIDRWSGFIGGLAKIQADAGEAPTVFDRIDFDKAVDEYGDALGVPATIIRSDEQVEDLREQRAQQARAQQMAASAQPIAQVAKAAKDLSETNVRGRSALDRLSEAAQANQ